METITELHDRAMECTDHAYFAGKRGDSHAELDFNRQALELEIKAAEMLRDKYEMEPSRSILYRSAACMAYACNEIAKAEKLAHFGLSGNPESSVKEELQDLLDQIALYRHFETMEIMLTKGEMQFSLAGNGLDIEPIKTQGRPKKGDSITKEYARKASDRANNAARLVFKMDEGTQKKDETKTNESGGVIVSVEIPKWLMEDILHPLSGKRLIVSGTLTGIRKDSPLPDVIAESASAD